MKLHQDEVEIEDVGANKYALVDIVLNKLSADRMNELYMSGDLDKIYEEFDITGKVKIPKRRKGNW